MVLTTAAKTATELIDKAEVPVLYTFTIQQRFLAGNLSPRIMLLNSLFTSQTVANNLSSSAFPN